MESNLSSRQFSIPEEGEIDLIKELLDDSLLQFTRISNTSIRVQIDKNKLNTLPTSPVKDTYLEILDDLKNLGFLKFNNDLIKIFNKGDPLYNKIEEFMKHDLHLDEIAKEALNINSQPGPSGLNRQSCKVTQQAGLKKDNAKDRTVKCQVPQCGQAFAQSSTLRKHQKTHSEVKSFTCDLKKDDGTQCGQAFARSGALKDHQKTHTKERPHKCDTCGKDFTQKGNLNRHIRTQHPSASTS